MCAGHHKMQERRTDLAVASCVTRFEHPRVVGRYMYFDASFLCSSHDAGCVLCSLRCPRVPNEPDLQAGFYDVVVDVRSSFNF